MVTALCRGSVLALLLPALAACKGPPARLVAGNADTVVVNNLRPVQLPLRVMDATGRYLDSSDVRYKWIAGAPVSVSTSGVVKCTQPGDATVRASLGNLVSDLSVRCRPVRDVQTSRMINLVVGGPAEELPFEAVGVDGQSVTLLAGEVSVSDSTIATVEGTRIRARAAGSTDVTMRVGDRQGFASVHVYERVRSPEKLRPGQHVAVPVRLAAGDMRRWQISAAPELYFLALLPDREDQQMPRLAIVGANCSPGLGPQSYFCLAQHDAAVIVYHPQHVDSARELSGTLAMWRQENR